ncbi:MAG: class II SORL domain-containing protein [Dehalococcoidia bacterium]|nr:class II SORL domain-containing protein [Dehalococcoidia bacterium]
MAKVKLAERIQEADWKKEKHVPVIDCPGEVKADEFFEVKVSLGKEIAHPNTTEHHIRWISLFFHPEGEKFTYQVGHYEFSAHGESVQGANQGPVYTHHEVTTSPKLSKSGTLYAMALCNIHGVWQSAEEIKVN